MQDQRNASRITVTAQPEHLDDLRLHLWEDMQHAASQISTVAGWVFDRRESHEPDMAEPAQRLRWLNGVISNAEKLRSTLDLLTQVGLEMGKRDGPVEVSGDREVVLGWVEDMRRDAAAWLDGTSGCELTPRWADYSRRRLAAIEHMEARSAA